MENELPQIHVHYPGDPMPEPPAELSDYQIQMIHSGLMVPNAESIRSMAREIRKWRGVQNPDAV